MVRTKKIAGPRGGQLWPGPGPHCWKAFWTSSELLLEGLFDRLGRLREHAACWPSGRIGAAVSNCSSGAVELGADQADLGQGPASFPRKALVVSSPCAALAFSTPPLAGFLEQIREIDAERIDQPAGYRRGTQDAEPPRPPPERLRFP